LHGNRFVLNTLCLKGEPDTIRMWALALSGAIHDAQFKTHDSIVYLLRMWNEATKGGRGEKEWTAVTP
jgi:hypothetical protein